MKNIEKYMQKQVNLIDNKFKKTTSDKIMCLLAVDLHKILEMKEYYKLNIEILNSTLDRYNQYSGFLSAYNDVYKNNYLYNQDINKKVAELYNYFNNYYGEVFLDNYKIRFNDNEIIDYASQFFEYYDKDIYDYFRYLLNNDKININMKYSDVQDADGYCLSLLSLRDTLVFVNGDMTIEVISTLIHEVIHSYVESFDYDISFEEFCNQDVNNLYDVYPTFIELVFLKYLEDIKFNYSDIRSLATGNYAASIMKLGYFDSLVNNDEIDTLFNDGELILDFIDNENYSYSFILSEYFFNKYLKDSNRCKNDILKFMLDSKKYDKKELLKSDIGNFSLIDKKKLVKNMKKYYGY